MFLENGQRKLSRLVLQILSIKTEEWDDDFDNEKATALWPEEADVTAHIGERCPHLVLVLGNECLLN